MFFDYFLQMSFFASCLALFGHVEAANRHSLFCCAKANPRSTAIADDRSTCFAICCAGGYTPPSSPTKEAIINKDSSLNKSTSKKKLEYEMKAENEGNEDTKAHYFFSQIYSPALLSTPGRLFVMLAFVVYIGASLWGASQIHEGLRMEHLAPDNSTSVRYFMNLRRYFRHYGQSVSLVFMLNPDLEYSDPIVQRDALELFTKLEQSSDGLFWGEDITEFWLRDYVKYLKNVTDVLSSPNERLDYHHFVNILRCKFLNHPQYAKYEDDIRFDATGTKILASRGIVVSRDTVDSVRERGIMVRAREVADSYPQLGVFAYNQEFVFYDQYITVLPLTIYNILIAIASVIIASTFMIVHPVCIFWLFMTILSIIVGIFGLMSIWEVDLDSISMVCIIICVGYCVDYATHLMHAYVISEHTNRKEKTVEAICDLGLTVCQAGCATTLAILAMATSEAYIFRTFFKTLFICIVLSSIHAMVLLPVFLSMFGPMGTRPDLAAKQKLENGKKSPVRKQPSRNNLKKREITYAPSGIVVHGQRSTAPNFNHVEVTTHANNIKRWSSDEQQYIPPKPQPVGNSTAAGLSTIAHSLSSSAATMVSGINLAVNDDKKNETVNRSAPTLPRESAAHKEFRRASGIVSSSAAKGVLLQPIHASTPTSTLSPTSTDAPPVPSPYDKGLSQSTMSTPVAVPQRKGKVNTGGKGH